MNPILHNPGCLLASVFGLVAMRKGYNDCKNDNKISGLSKIVFGGLIAGGSIAYAVYNQAPGVPPLKSCDPGYDIDVHPSCQKVLEVVKGALNRTEFGLLSNTSISYPTLPPESYENLHCGVTKNDMGELECFITPLKDGFSSFWNKGINLAQGSTSAVWMTTKDSVTPQASKVPTTNEIFRMIPGCETIQRLQIHIINK